MEPLLRGTYLEPTSAAVYHRRQFYEELSRKDEWEDRLSWKDQLMFPVAS